MIRKPITISNKYGLHIRAAAKLVDLAKRFQSKIELHQNTQVVDCKSIMSVITLGAQKGACFDLVINGQDAAKADEAITTLINDHFGEKE